MELDLELKRFSSYDEILEEELPEKFSCPICLSLQREAYLTICCGHHFCRACIQEVARARAPCPLCKYRSVTAFPNKQRQREISQLRVRCPFNRWKGKEDATQSMAAEGDNRNQLLDGGSCPFTRALLTVDKEGGGVLDTACPDSTHQDNINPGDVRGNNGQARVCGCLWPWQHRQAQHNDQGTHGAINGGPSKHYHSYRSTKTNDGRMRNADSACLWSGELGHLLQHLKTMHLKKCVSHVHTHRERDKMTGEYTV